MVKFCYDIITFWMCDFNLVLIRCFFKNMEKLIVERNVCSSAELNGWKVQD